MATLSQIEINKFLDEHLRHRLTLLRTLRKRRENNDIQMDDGNVYRCIKDSNLIAVRLLLDFLGLKGIPDGSDYILVENHIKINKKEDVKIDDFPPCRLLVPSDVPIAFHRILAGVYKRADKELAHVTSKYNDEFNEEPNLIKSATIIEELMTKFLYEILGKRLPDMDA